MDYCEEIIARINNKFDRRAQGSQDIISWGLKYFPDYFTKQPGRHHLEIGNRLMYWSNCRGVRAVLKAPRFSAKSTLLNFLYPIWSICNRKEQYILQLADTYSQAVKHLKGIKNELETNDALHDDYPGACGVGKEWNDDGIITRNGIRIEPLGAGQKIRGRREFHRRPTLIIIDDPEGDEAAYSEASRGTTRDWAVNGVFKAGGEYTNIILAGTSVHRECLINHCSNLPGWEIMAYRAIESWPDRMDLWDQWEQILRDTSTRQGNNPVNQAEYEAKQYYDAHKSEMNRGAQVLWPENEDLYSLMFMRASEGHTSFESEKQNNPIDPSKCEWPPECFEGADLYFDDWPEDPDCVVMALDPSKGKNDKAGDYQAIIILAVKDGLLYVDADIQRRPIRQMIMAFVELCGVIRPDTAVVESVQFQEMIVGECEDAAIKRKIIAPIEPIDTGGVSKIVRIRRLGPYINRRRIRFKRRSNGVKLLIQQLQDFPNGEHDDGCFVAGTMIETLSGLKPIEVIEPGEMVLTRHGYNKVKIAGCTGIKDVLQVNFIDGRNLTGTKNHPVMTENGWVPLSKIVETGGSVICGKKLLFQKQLFTKELNLEDTQMQNNGHIKCIIGPMADMQKMASKHYIRKYGRIITVEFQTDMKSIIRMEIHSTMTSTTSNVFSNQNIEKSMLSLVLENAMIETADNLMSQDTWHLYGINQKLEENGIVNMEKIHGLVENKSKLHVQTVEKHTKRCSLKKQLTSVLQNAECDHIQKMEDYLNSDVALFAMGYFSPTNTDLPFLVVLDVANIIHCGRKPVFNLSVEGCHEYFANGVLVHNCDALEYGLRRAAQLLNTSQNDSVSNPY